MAGWVEEEEKGSKGRGKEKKRYDFVFAPINHYYEAAVSFILKMNDKMCKVQHIDLNFLKNSQS